MSNRSETFGRLLKGAINSVAAYEGKIAPAIEDELGDQIGVAGSTIQRYKAGYLPTEPRVIQILAEVAVRRGYLSRAWLQRFLQAARYPAAEALLAQLADTPASSAVLPGGTLIFLFTDVEGSTELWERDRAAAERAIARHDAIVRQTMDSYGGHVFNTAGDAFHVAFTTASDALDAALAAQRALAAEAWGLTAPIRVRAALHAGAAQQRDGDYYGPPLNRIARLCATGHGGQILLSNAAQELVRDALPKGTGLRDLGEHRLKDLARPERIFQIVVSDLPSDFPALRSLDAYRHNLPAQPTPLIGRESAVLAVADRVRRDGVRLLTLTGPGGTGKTRLALQVAADLLDEFHDGVWFVALAPIRDSTLVLAAIAHALGVIEATGQTLDESLKAYLRSRQVLLVLDNFEHVLEAGPLIAALLAAAPGLKAIVTSRETLHLYGEHEYGVPPLSLPDMRRLPPIERLTQYEAVRLFIERAQAVRPDFVVTTDNAPAVAEICVRLDGLPLAIELAAARGKLFPPKALLSRLDRRLSMLTGGPRDLPARQQTLRNTIAWSYDLLDAAEQAVFARLGVFVGGCTIKAAEAVLADDQIGGDDLTAYIPTSALLEGVLSLVDKSLLKEGADPGDEPRFLMLETIHEYALERLEDSGEADAIQRRHARFFTEFAETAEPHLYGAGQPAWVRSLEVDHPNLRAVLAWAIEHASPIGLRLAGALGWFWHFHSHHHEGRDWLLKALAGAKDAQGTEVDRWRAKALNQVGYLSLFVHDLMQAHSSLEQSVALWRTVRHPRGLAHALCDWGAAAYFEGDLPDARTRLEESITVFRQLGEKQGLVRALFWHGLVACLQRDLAIARASAEESINLGREVGDVSNIAASMSGVLAYIAFLQADYAGAQSLWEEGLRLAREVDDKPGIALTLSSLGSVIYLHGHAARAKPIFEEGLQIWHELGSQHNIGWGLDMLGYVALQQHDLRHAASLFEESLTLRRDLKETHTMAWCLAGLAGVAVAEGRMEWAARLLATTAGLQKASGKNFDATTWIGAGHIPIISQAEFERHVAAVRAALGDAAFDAAWAAGRALTLEQAIAEALAISASSE